MNYMRVVLDTNFILYCIKKKIDIEEEIKKINENGKLELILLSPVLQEIKNFSVNKEKKLKDRMLAEVFLKMFKERVINVRVIDVNQKNPDEAIKVFCLKNKDVFLASYDKELKKKLKNKLVFIRKNRIVVA